MIGFLLWIIVGGLAGYIAERLMGEDHSLVMNVALGIAGSFIVNIVLAIFMGMTGGNLLAQLVTGVIGASLLIWGYRIYKSRS